MIEPKKHPMAADLSAGADTDDDGDDLVAGSTDLPMDARDGDVGTGEPCDGSGDIEDTDVDAPVGGSPDDDVIQDEDDE